MHLFLTLHRTASLHIASLCFTMLAISSNTCQIYNTSLPLLFTFKKKISLTYKVCVFVTERCLDTDHEVFAKMLLSDGQLSQLEFTLYQKWFALLQVKAFFYY
jgi:hypothetical protein